jgi:CubicO group peptidase (beta-lactamase class C family)
MLMLPVVGEWGDCNNHPICDDPCDVVATEVDGRPEEVVSAPNASVDAAAREEMTRQKLVGLGIGVIEGGHVRYLKGFGRESVVTDEPVLAKRTMFRWASMSKMITGVIAAQLWREGVLDPDRDISTVWPAYHTPSVYFDADGNERTVPLASRKQTVRLLLGHLGGIQHYSNGQGPLLLFGENDPGTNTGIEWAARKVIDRKLVGVPGDHYSYSSYGINIAGVVLEHLSGESFASMARDRVSVPAQLRTLQPDYEWVDIPHRAVGYLNLEGVNVSTGSSDVSWKLPSGGFISTVEDLAKFCGALGGSYLLDPSAKAQVWTPQRTTADNAVPYGWGFQITKRNGKRIVGHGGSQQKTRTALRYDVENDRCFVMMTNSEQTNPDDVLDAIEAAWLN